MTFLLYFSFIWNCKLTWPSFRAPYPVPRPNLQQIFEYGKDIRHPGKCAPVEDSGQIFVSGISNCLGCCELWARVPPISESLRGIRDFRHAFQPLRCRSRNLSETCWKKPIQKPKGHNNIAFPIFAICDGIVKAKKRTGRPLQPSKARKCKPTVRDDKSI